MFSAGEWNRMSRRERATAAFLLVVAVAGAALLPRLLSSAPPRLGIALGPSPGLSVVRAPALPTAPRRTAPPHTAPTPEAAPVAVRSEPLRASASRRTAPAPRHSHAAPRTAATTQPSTPPVAVAAREPLPAATASGIAAAALEPSTHRHGPPILRASPLARGPKPGRRSSEHDLRGSGHGSLPPVPPHAVGAHHRSLGHLATPPPGAAPSADEARANARPHNRVPGDQGGPPQAAVEHGRGP